MDRKVVPAIPRRFRGVWVAPVGNLDWPSRPGLPVEQQEALAVLDRCVELRLNAVVLQIRPQCDALYASSLEPWSYFLTGKQGKATDPFYDPLEFWIADAHSHQLSQIHG